MIAIIKKELKSYFLSPIGYVFIGLFLLMASLFFYLDVISYATIRFEDMFYSLTTILTFIIPILTMRTFAEERSKQTETLLFTSPVSIPRIVLGKFLSCAIVLVITEILTLFYFVILTFLGTPEIITAIATLIGFLLLGLGFIAFGIFASSITENQIVAGVITIGFSIMMWFLPELFPILSVFSLNNMFVNFPSGIIAIKEIVGLVSFSILFVLLTMIVLQRRKSVK